MGRPIETTNPLDGKRLNVYDLAGQLTAARNELGFWTTTTYHQRGWVSRITDPKGYWIDYSYEPNGLSTGWTDSLGRGASTQYDQLDRVKKQIDGNGNFVETTYWEDGEVKEVTDQLGAITRSVVNLGGRSRRLYRGYGLGVLQQSTSPGDAAHETSQALPICERAQLMG
jgi:YD repeat-containing protein